VKWGPDSNVSVGSIIVCVKDMGYLKVDEVTPDGLICNCAFGPFLYTWDTLDDLWAAVDSVPDAPDYETAASRAHPPRLVACGGNVDLNDPAPVNDGTDSREREFELAVLTTLLSIAPPDWKEIFFKIDLLDLDRPARTVLFDVVDSAGHHESRPITEDLSRMLSEARWSKRCGRWSIMELNATRLDNDRASYRIDYDYTDYFA
jgi:hypothetical protein